MFVLVCGGSCRRIAFAVGCAGVARGMARSAAAGGVPGVAGQVVRWRGAGRWMRGRATYSCRADMTLRRLTRSDFARVI